MPLALDLFCGAGGASMGLHQAGFEVIGVDIEPHCSYPFTFVQADATRPPFDLARFDFVWASPPCQRFSRGTPESHRARHPDLIEPIRCQLAASGALTCIENVPGAPIRGDLILDGDMFGLGTHRQRWFELNFFTLAPPPNPRFGPLSRPGAVTVAGGGGRRHGNVAAWKSAMGIDWMSRCDLREAIPPAYGEFIGRAALRCLTRRAA